MFTVPVRISNFFIWLRTGWTGKGRREVVIPYTHCWGHWLLVARIGSENSQVWCGWNTSQRPNKDVLKTRKSWDNGTYDWCLPDFWTIVISINECREQRTWIHVDLESFSQIESKSESQVIGWTREKPEKHPQNMAIWSILLSNWSFQRLVSSGFEDMVVLNLIQFAYLIFFHWQSTT